MELTAYDAQYRIPWIVFDRDMVQGFDEIIAEAKSKGIQTGWSNPCFEIKGLRRCVRLQRCINWWRKLEERGSIEWISVTCLPAIQYAFCGKRIFLPFMISVPGILSTMSTARPR
ncbi:MAG: RloB family protein [Lachnospiraceae bacterium]